MKKIVLALMLVVGSLVHGKSITIGMSEWPPFESELAEEYGVFSKKLTMVLNEMGYDDINYEFMPWARQYTMVKRGVIPAGFCWYYTKEREEEVYYPKNPVASADDVVWYKKSKFPNGLEAKDYADIAKQKLKVVGIKSYYYVKPLKDAGADLHEVTKPELSWRFLDKERADILIQNDIVGEAEIIEALGKERVKDFAHTKPIVSNKAYVLFSRAHDQGKELRDAFDVAYEKLKAAGKI